MAKHINIIARTNGVGLDSDVSLITHALETAGYKVTYSHSRSRSLLKKWFCRKHKPQFDANIFLERIFPVWHGAAKTNLLIPNQERFPKRHTHRLKNIDHVLCKSKHAYEIFSALGASSKYISFTSKDTHLNDQPPYYGQFFHLAGRSTLKGTETILALWKKHPEWPRLTIIQHKDNAPDSTPENVRLVAEYLPYDELISLANKNSIHLCTSLSEGWGHYIVEAMSSKAVVITTDAPPMNELISNDRGILVPPHKAEPRHLGTNFYVDPELLEQAIVKIITTPTEEKEQLGLNARQWYEQNHQQFVANLTTILADIL